MATTYNMPKHERETHITFNAEDDCAIVDTFDPVQIRKLDKLANECPDKYRLVLKEDCLGNTRAKYEVADKKLVAFKKPVTREYTDEQRAAMRDRLIRVRNASMQS